MEMARRVAPVQAQKLRLADRPKEEQFKHAISFVRKQSRRPEKLKRFSGPFIFAKYCSQLFCREVFTGLWYITITEGEKKKAAHK